MAIEYPVRITYSNDTASLNKSTKEAGKKANKNTKTGIGVGGVAGGVAIGGILANMLSSLDSITKILDVIGGAINAFVAPFVPILLTLLKPFLALFLVVGSYLAKWLKFMLSGGTGKAGEGAVVKSKGGGEVEAGSSLIKSLSLIAGAIAGVVAFFMGAPVLLAGAIALLVGYLTTKFSEPFVNFTLWLGGLVDKLLGTDFVGALSSIYQGITDTVMGFLDILISIVNFDWEGVKAGLLRMFLGLWEILKGIFLFAWNLLKAILVGLWVVLKNTFLASFEVLKTIGKWIWDNLTGIFSSTFRVLSNLGSWLYRKIKSFFSFGGGRSHSANDAIITPTGQVVQTNPQDYIIATKNPGSLGGGNNVNVTINVNGSMDKSSIDELVRRLQQELRTRGGY